LTRGTTAGAAHADATVGVAVDVVALTLQAGRLHAAVVRVGRAAERALPAFPGGRVRERESLDHAARRWLGDALAGAATHLEQLYTFGEPGRDPASRVVSVAYLALLPHAVAADGVEWLPCEPLPRFAYDHRTIARVALERLRAKLAYTNLACALLERSFTLAELQQVYETVLGRALDRRNFRKRVLALDLVTPLGATRYGAHRPARLYRAGTRRPIVVAALGEHT
jgi:8-oxo-dGTP diphosphatase